MKTVTVWEWKGDPSRTDGYTVIGEDETGERVLIGYDSLSGASSAAMAREGIRGEWIMDRPKAEELHDRILTMDRVFWPPFNPTLVRVENREVVERFTPED